MLLGLALAFGPGCGLIGGDEEKATVARVKRPAAGKKPAARRPAAKKRKAEEGDESKLTMKKLVEIYEAKAREHTFDPEGMVDPFRPIEAVMPRAPEAEEKPETVPLTPLQRMTLSQLKLKAVVMAGRNTRAMLEDSAGMGYIIKTGDLVGTREGRVMAIHQDRVEIKEFFKSYTGKKKARISVLRIKPIEGEKR